MPRRSGPSTTSGGRALLYAPVMKWDRVTPWLAVASLGVAIACMTLTPEGPRPRTSLQLGWLAWAVLAGFVVLFLRGRKIGWTALAFIEAFYSALFLFFGLVGDVRSVLGLVFLLVSLALMLTPSTRANVGLGSGQGLARPVQ